MGEDHGSPRSGGRGLGRRRRDPAPRRRVSPLSVAAGVTDRDSLEQRSRDAGRREQLATVAQLLGGVRIDHFVEVTLVAFYQLAQVVAPITVCLNQDTRDSYSGADFRRGYQQITASQAWPSSASAAIG